MTPDQEQRLYSFVYYHTSTFFHNLLERASTMNLPAPTEREDLKPTFHRDGSVSFYSRGRWGRLPLGVISPRVANSFTDVQYSHWLTAFNK
jgi:hypothetical protein